MIALLVAAQLAIVARAPDTAATCVPFEVTVAVRSPGAAMPRVDPPSGRFLQLLKSGVSTRLERDALGRPTLLSEFSYLVAATTSGRLQVPAIVATSGGASARSAPIAIDVRAGGNGPPLVLVRSTLDAGRARRADTVWVGQQVDYVVDVQLNEAARQRLRRNPTFFPPEMPAVLAYDLAAPPPVMRDGRQCFETLSYRRALFPLFPGATRISPATLTYSLPLSTSFFSREESFELRTDTVRFVAIDAPVNGRPSDFAGAVGTISASARVDAPSSRMGDPIVFTLRLAGRGNVKLLPRPSLALEWAAVAPGEERVRVDTTSALVHGTKEFDWLLTPRRAGRLAVPPIRYAYFDPVRGAYDVASTDSVALVVASADLASADTASASRLPVRRQLREERPAPFPTRAWYWALLLLAPAPATLRRIAVRRRHLISTESAARRLRSFGRAQSAPSPRELRRAFVDALRERVPSVGEGTRPRTSLARVLRRAGVTEATATAAHETLELLDRAAFSPSGTVDRSLIARSLEIVRAVDGEAVRPAARGSAVATAIVATALLGVAIGAMPEAVRRSFDEGVQAYERGQYTASQRLFARAAARAPRAADAWANLGVAAWARGDTAHAVLGWQRALRLEPLDVESRERLALVQPPIIGAPAYVPPVPVNALAVAALMLWTAAWIALWINAAHRTPYVRPFAGGAIVVAIVSLVSALELQERAGVRGLGAARRGRELLDAPGVEGSPVASVSAGEVGLLGVREGGWVRLAIDGARAGWIPVASVLPLDAAGVD